MIDGSDWMKKVFGYLLLILATGALGACSSQKSSFDAHAQEAMASFLEKENQLFHLSRKEMDTSSFHEDLNKESIKEIYYSEKDFNSYVFVVKDNLYKDPDLTVLEENTTKEYLMENGDENLIFSEEEYNPSMVDKKSNFQLIYKAE